MKKAKNPFEQVEEVASLNECTGLMPALPQNEAQDASLAALYAIHEAEKSREKKRKK